MIVLDDTTVDELSIAETEQDLPKEIKDKKKRGQLRTGFTTGTSASAATKAALQSLLTNRIVNEIPVTLPKGQKVKIPIAWTKIGDSKVTCAVIKNGGDDPDVTHGAEICSTVELTSNIGKIQIYGGEGVGKVTKPGLGLPIGGPAINPVPMKMIKESVYDILTQNKDYSESLGIKITA